MSGNILNVIDRIYIYNIIWKVLTKVFVSPTPQFQYNVIVLVEQE
jgi:hypothetical protein